MKTHVMTSVAATFKQKQQYEADILVSRTVPRINWNSLITQQLEREKDLEDGVNGWDEGYDS